MPSEAPVAKTGTNPREDTSRADALLENLNPPQREAVAHGTGPLLVLAGAGSGKTRVLTHRVAHLVATGQAKPSEILAITFTNKAAQEMRDRVEGLVGRMVRVMWVSTFHSACARILRAEAERLGYTKRFTIYDEADSVRLVRRCLDELCDRPEALRPARDQVADLAREEPARGRGRLPRAGQLLLRADRRRRVRPLREAHPRDERDRLRRPAVSHRERARAVPRGGRALPAHLPLDPRRRVPGHQPRPVPAAAAAGRRGAQHLRRGRRRPVDLRLPRRRRQQHPRLRARLPRREGREARAELPLHADDPVGRQRGRLAQRGPQAEGAVDRPRRGRAGARRRAPGRARRGALHRRRDRAPRARRASRATTSRSSTGRTRRAACSRTCSCARTSPTR